MSTKETGKLGEKIAEDFLKNKGYKILDRNYAFRIFGPQKGEIDIIAKNKGTICFVEVKALRRSAPQGKRQICGGQTSAFFPELKVNFQKQRKIIKSAQSWLMRNKIPLDSQWRMDVVSVIIDEDGGKTEIRHLENCFS